MISAMDLSGLETVLFLIAFVVVGSALVSVFIRGLVALIAFTTRLDQENRQRQKDAR